MPATNMTGGSRTQSPSNGRPAVNDNYPPLLMRRNASLREAQQALIDRQTRQAEMAAVTLAILGTALAMGILVILRLTLLP